MRPGDVIKNRFEIGNLAGIGGMAEVFRAHDREADGPVAIKVLLDDYTGRMDPRFEREAQMLAELHHPTLVHYVDHGITESGQQYLAMEWLEGQVLSVRLERGALTINEAVTVCRQMAQALCVVHDHGIVHRDLKPSNTFLVDSDVEQVKVFDFGVARIGGGTTTQAGAVVGTVGYMAPEQARSDHEVDTRADIFSLGCVFFECLTGVSPFSGQYVMAVLAKILFEPSPQVTDLRPDVPAAIDQLVARMLSKEPDERPRDGAALLAEFAALDSGELLEVPRLVPPALLSLSGGERRLFSVIMLGRLSANDTDPTLTLRNTAESGDDDDLRQNAEARGGRFVVLADGTCVVTITASTRNATDQAALAARCALALHERAPGRSVVLTTGQGEVSRRLPVGEAIDRAVSMLLDSGGRSAVVAIDDVTARLLNDRFEVVATPKGATLVRERDPADGEHTLLGKPTPCVGRERELATLADRLQWCIDGPQADATLVVAPPGIGKSRLVGELISLLHERHPKLDAWIGHGDAQRAGSAFALLGQALRNTARVADGEPIDIRRDKLRARVACSVPEAECARVTMFLGEIIGVPFPDDESPMLRAARQDAMTMSEHIERAWQDFLRAETSLHPVLIVLENLHWGDLPTVRLIDSALRDLKDQPLMVLALARPEVRDIFPKLWSNRNLTEIRLKELNAASSERMVRHVLGGRVTDATVRRVVRLADGNAFYLEELIRAVAEGHGDELPLTVLAMVTSRLEGLEDEARRVLRAGSVFGEVFWKGGVDALLGGRSRASIDGWLTVLTERELLVRRPDSRFPEEREIAFRHSLLREGAYAMLVEGDRTIGHQLAASWLEQKAEGNPMVLAEHLERGGDRARAAPYFLRAAEQAHWGNDAATAISLARRGLTDNAADEVRAGLFGLLCEASVWTGDPGAAAQYGEETLRLATPGSAPWARAALLKIGFSLLQNRVDDLLGMLETVRSVDPAPEALDTTALALCIGIFVLDLGGHFPLAQLFRQRLRAVVEPVAAVYPVARGWMFLADTQRIAWAEENHWGALAAGRQSHEAFIEAGFRRGALEAQVFIGMALWRLGRHAEATQVLHEAEAAEQGLGLTGSLRTVSLIGVLVDSGEVESACVAAQALVARCQALGFPPNEGRARWALADALRTAGDLDGADREFVLAIELMAMLPLDQAAATTMRGRLRLDQGRAAEALADVADGLNRLNERGAVAFRGDYARLVHADALHATGDIAGAARAIAAARDHILAQANKISDEAVKKSFLELVPENRRTLELAAEWLGDEAAS